MFFNQIHTRMRVALIVVIVILVAIILRVFYIQIFQYEKLSNLATSLWSRELPITADRGEIRDRNGKVLATNITTTSLVVIPNQIKNKEEVAAKLAEILSVTYDEMYRHISKKTSIERVHPEGRQLSYEVAEKINNLNYDGVYLVKESKRYYPYGNVLSHVLGYVGIDNQGLGGIELMYDKYLTGENGAIKYFSDAKGGKINLSEIYLQPASGMNITLTIDINIQLAVERELNNVESTLKPDNSLAIVVDPNTLEILAMSSRPTFNPNNYKIFTTEVLNRNLPIWMTYEPGSTFKLITSSAALEEGITDTDNGGEFNCSGSIEIAGVRIKCWRYYRPHGSESLRLGLMNSCNPVFIGLGQKIGVTKYYEYLRRFGLFNKTGIRLPGEANSIFVKEEKAGPVELATISFGQRFEITPLQMITAVSTIANDGVYIKPRIVKSIQDSTTGDITEMPIETGEQVISKENSEKVLSMMNSVVSEGTGKNAKVIGYNIGGKTGTSEDGVNTGKYVTSFCGVAETDNPEIVLLITLYNPTGEGGHQGGGVAAPIAGQIFSEVLPYLNT